VFKTPGVSVCGIRPEHLLLEQGPQALEATVANVQPLGNETLIEVDVAGTALLVRAASHAAPAMGSAITVSFDPARVHRFDATGRRIEG
jgi:ABC-type sugar transport system ATPase subunit